MTIASSKLTSRGKTSLPAEVRRKLGLGPGSVLVWEEDGARVVVRRAGKHSSEDVHAAVFPDATPAPRTVAALKEGVRDAMRKRHARR